MFNTIPHTYVRALEVEGTHPADSGCWGLTIWRLMFGEGVPAEDDPHHDLPLNPDGSYPHTPPLDPRTLNRVLFYRRVRSEQECRSTLAQGHAVNAAVELTESWVAPPDGTIADPVEGEALSTETHGLLLPPVLSMTPDYVFPNTWGDTWGHHGWGRFSPAYFETYAFDAWVMYQVPDQLTNFRIRERKPTRSAWSATDAAGIKLYSLVTTDGSGTSGDRLGWAFAVEKNGFLEVEELYVRPAWRGKGIGRDLVVRLQGLAAAKKMRLRLWVPFADAFRDSRGTQDALLAVCRRMGLRFTKTPVRWAAYLAEPDGASEFPIEPDFYPNRPRSTFAAMAASFLTAIASPTLSDAVPAAAALAHNTPDYTAWFPTPGTPEWGVMNRVRGSLIKKKVRGELSVEENKLYELLQRRVDESIEEHFPISTPR